MARHTQAGWGVSTSASRRDGGWPCTWGGGGAVRRSPRLVAESRDVATGRLRAGDRPDLARPGPSLSPWTESVSLAGIARAPRPTVPPLAVAATAVGVAAAGVVAAAAARGDGRGVGGQYPLGSHPAAWRGRRRHLPTQPGACPPPLWRRGRVQRRSGRRRRSPPLSQLLLGGVGVRLADVRAALAAAGRGGWRRQRRHRTRHRCCRCCQRHRCGRVAGRIGGEGAAAAGAAREATAGQVGPPSAPCEECLPPAAESGGAAGGWSCRRWGSLSGRPLPAVAELVLAAAAGGGGARVGCRYWRWRSWSWRPPVPPRDVDGAHGRACCRPRRRRRPRQRDRRHFPGGTGAGP